MLRTARLTCGTRTRSMRCACASYAMAVRTWHAATPQDSTCRSCAPFAWRRCTGACIRDLHHPPSCAVQYVATRRRPALHVHNSDGTRDGMPSKFLTADHCVSHHMLHSACVMRMCCGVGLSMAGLSHYTTNEHGLSRVQHLLRATTTSSTARLAPRARDLHRALRGQLLTPGTPDLSMAMAPKNRKLGSECVHRRIVPVRMCASVRSRWCVCMSDRRRIDVGRFLFIRAM